jgi:hypothetical protein
MIPEDLVAIQKLWANDHAIDTLKRELSEARLALDDLSRGLEDTRLTLQEAQVRREALKVEVRQIHRRIETYQTRITDTQRLIDLGRAPDYLMATRQVSSCVAIVDELETRALEFMEQEETLDATLHALSSRLVDTERAMEESRARFLVLDATTREQLARRVEEQPGLLRDVPLELRERYNTLRRQGRKVLATVRDARCLGCNFVLSPQVWNELLRHARVHNCRHCGRFLVVEEEPEDPSHEALE